DTTFCSGTSRVRTSNVGVIRHPWAARARSSRRGCRSRFGRLVLSALELDEHDVVAVQVGDVGEDRAGLLGRWAQDAHAAAFQLGAGGAAVARVEQQERAAVAALVPEPRARGVAIR